MAVQVPSSSIGTGVRVTVGEGDTIIVRESYDIISTDSEAISGLITSATLEIAGYVFGRLAPYFERPCRRSPTPDVSRTPLTV